MALVVQAPDKYLRKRAVARNKPCLGLIHKGLVEMDSPRKYPGVHRQHGSVEPVESCSFACSQEIHIAMQYHLPNAAFPLKVHAEKSQHIWTVRLARLIRKLHGRIR